MNKSRKRQIEMARVAMLGLLMMLPLTSEAQRLLTLDSCRAMALRNNKQMGVAKMKQEVKVSAESERCGWLHVDE